MTPALSEISTGDKKPVSQKFISVTRKRYVLKLVGDFSTNEVQKVTQIHTGNP